MQILLYDYVYSKPKVPLILTQLDKGCRLSIFEIIFDIKYSIFRHQKKKRNVDTKIHSGFSAV